MRKRGWPVKSSVVNVDGEIIGSDPLSVEVLPAGTLPRRNAPGVEMEYGPPGLIPDRGTDPGWDVSPASHG